MLPLTPRLCSEMRYLAEAPANTPLTAGLFFSITSVTLCPWGLFSSLTYWIRGYFSHSSTMVSADSPAPIGGLVF